MYLLKASFSSVSFLLLLLFLLFLLLQLFPFLLFLPFSFSFSFFSSSFSYSSCSGSTLTAKWAFVGRLSGPYKPFLCLAAPRLRFMTFRCGCFFRGVT